MVHRAAPLLYVEDVYKWYGDKCVLDNIDLSMQKGEFCSLIGPSGCGKSTFFRLILGEERPTFGTLLFEGKPIGFPNSDRGIVYQKYSLYPHLSVLENVALGKKLSADLAQIVWRSKEIREEALYYLDKVLLSDQGGKYPYELSGGMQQRVAIAQALIMKPKILLMDEPFGALDPGTREDLQLFLLDLWEELHMTIFFVTHDLEEALFLGTRILALSQYYTDDRGEKCSERGAKIVVDRELPRKLVSTREKETAQFGGIIQELRHQAFDSAYLQHVKDFDFRHPDSFRTLTEAEFKKGEGG